MTHATVVKALHSVRDTLRSPFPLTWRYPQKVPSTPLAAHPRKNWSVYHEGPGPWRKNEKNWFYSDITFPSRLCGISLANTVAEITINGWQPFTLWIDGEELFSEKHAWHATGPIADPHLLTIEPGRQHRLIMCVEPTELPSGGISVNVEIVPRVCADYAVELDAAAVQLSLAQMVASTARERAICAAAVACFSEEDFARKRIAALRSSCAEMEQILSPLSAKVKTLTVHLLGHAHIDMDWLWTWEDTVHCIRRDFASVTSVMKDYPELTFAHSQVPTYQVVQKKDPAVFKATLARIAEGRWENTAATWVECDLNMAQGETLIRQMQYAREWTKDHLHDKATVFWAPDTFGHPANMPQLVTSAGFTSYFHMRCNPGEYENVPVRIWTGVDGTSIRALSKVYNDDLRPSSLFHTVRENTRNGLRHCLHVWGIGNHGGALSRMQLRRLALYKDKPLIPTIRFSTVKEYCAALDRCGDPLPRNEGEVRSVFEGCFTTHAQLKYYNRLCENTLLNAEVLTTLAGMNCKKELHAAWVPALFNQFHDILDGSSVHDAYIDAHRRGEESYAAARTICKKAADALTVRTKDFSGITVINPCGFTRTEPLRLSVSKKVTALKDTNGAVIPVQHGADESICIVSDIPAFGMKTYTAVTRATDCDKTQPIVEENEMMITVETVYARIKIMRRSGVICSYYDKALQRELVSYGEQRYMTWDAARRDLGLNVLYNGNIDKVLL